MSTPVLTAAPAPTDRSVRRPRVLWRPLLALVSGLVLALSFPPGGYWPLAPLAVAGLSVACGARPQWLGSRPGLWGGLGLGTVFGIAFFVPLLAWLRVVGVDAWLLLATFQALFLGLLGVGLVLVSRLPCWPAWAACLWVAEELVRGRLPFGGFPWGRLAFSQGGTPYAAFASLGGAALVTLAVAGSGVLLAAAMGGTRSRRAAALVLAAGLVPVAGLAIPLPVGGERGSGPPAATVAVVQGNVPRLGLSAFDQEREVLRRHVEATLRLSRLVGAGRLPRPELVVWPENSSDIDPFQDTAAREAIGRAARAVGVPILVGAVLDAGPTALRNAGIVWDPRTGPGATYVKRHPVPFGEYLPFRSTLSSLVGRFSLIPRDFLAGRRPGVLQVGPARLGDVICFEIAYDGVVRDAVRGGGRLLVVQTNNATYGRSGETAQQLAMSRVRAVEHGRAVLIAATSGVSAVIAPDGSVRQRSAVFTPALLVDRVPLRDSRTVADRLGAAPEWGLALLGLAAALAAGVRRRRGAA